MNKTKEEKIKGPAIFIESNSSPNGPFEGNYDVISKCNALRALNSVLSELSELKEQLRWRSVEEAPKLIEGFYYWIMCIDNNGLPYPYNIATEEDIFQAMKDCVMWLPIPRKEEE